MNKSFLRSIYLGLTIFASFSAYADQKISCPSASQARSLASDLKYAIEYQKSYIVLSLSSVSVSDHDWHLAAQISDASDKNDACKQAQLLGANITQQREDAPNIMDGKYVCTYSARNLGVVFAVAR